MSRKNRLAEGDWEQYWDERPIDDWEDQLSADRDFQDELEMDWEDQKAHVFRCPRCGTKKLVDTESYSFFRTSGACEDCMWETKDASQDGDDFLDED